MAMKCASTCDFDTYANREQKRLGPGCVSGKSCQDQWLLTYAQYDITVYVLKFRAFYSFFLEQNVGNQGWN